MVKVVDIAATEADHNRGAVAASQPSNRRRIRTRSLARIYGGVEKLADGMRREPMRVATHITLPGIPSNITGLRALHLIPWLKITRHDDNIEPSKSIRSFARYVRLVHRVRS